VPLRVQIVTAEREVFADDAVDMVVAPGSEGVLGILPRHAPLLTTLQPGEIRIKRGGTEEEMAVSGGFLQIARDQVLILADTAERAEELDAARAEDARRRAPRRSWRPSAAVNGCKPKPRVWRCAVPKCASPWRVAAADPSGRTPAQFRSSADKPVCSPDRSRPNFV